MYSYCTLFDSNYLARGLAMHESLAKHSHDFHLYIFAFDDKSYDMLTLLSLKKVTVISLKEFEDDELLRIKDSRMAGEYCWTCTPSTIKYCIEKYDLPSCTYLDADLYFYSDPSILIDEMGEKSVLITEHRYTPQYDQSTASGIYCVQFMTFKNDTNGLRVLHWWRDSCNEWCYNRVEDGKFGDQKYLDDWTSRFEGVHVLQNIGGGVAPWNIQQYDISDSNFEIIFYHFHNYKIVQGDQVDLGVYALRHRDIDVLYKPYTKHIYAISDHLKTLDPLGDYNGTVAKRPSHWMDPLRVVRRRLKDSYYYNLFSKKSLIG